MKNLNLEIISSKNLLAFSSGVDSTALFFLLLEKNIPFDIAIVNYNQRAQSKDEVIYATQLAHKFKKKCFISEYPKNMKFSEKDARDYRYNFFNEIIEENNYESLITAHQLNDKLEWFLMQLTKGAGLSELIGMEAISYSKNYQLLKPLLDISKKELQDYLDNNFIKYFIDQTNHDEKYKRNYFRHNFSDRLIEEYQSGITKSFSYLEKDKTSLFQHIQKKEIEELSIYEYNGDVNIALRIIDQELKKRGIIISSATRDEIITNKEMVISHKISVALTNNKIYISPSISISMNKKFKEKCRVQKIPKNIRPYFFYLEQEQLFTL